MLSVAAYRKLTELFDQSPDVTRRVRPEFFVRVHSPRGTAFLTC